MCSKLRIMNESTELAYSAADTENGFMSLFCQLSSIATTANDAYIM